MDEVSQRMDEKIAELRASVDTSHDGDRQAALREYDAARTDLRLRMDELRVAGADTWADAKVRVQAAWARLQAAYERTTKDGTAR
jgi:broad specificity phosphatase PhoE